MNAEQPAFAGDPAALRDRLTELAEMGFEMVQLRFARMFDATDLELFVDQVMPHFR